MAPDAPLAMLYPRAVGAHGWNKLSDADRKTFVEVFRQASARNTAEIIEAANAPLFSATSHRLWRRHRP